MDCVLYASYPKLNEQHAVKKEVATMNMLPGYAQQSRCGRIMAFNRTDGVTAEGWDKYELASQAGACRKVDCNKDHVPKYGKSPIFATAY